MLDPIVIESHVLVKRIVVRNNFCYVNELVITFFCPGSLWVQHFAVMLESTNVFFYTLQDRANHHRR